MKPELEETQKTTSPLATLGLLLFLVTLVSLDGIWPFLFGPTPLVSILSIASYSMVLVFAYMAVKVEGKKEKKDKNIQGNMTLIAAQAVMSVWMILTHLRQLMIGG